MLAVFRSRQMPLESVQWSVLWSIVGGSHICQRLPCVNPNAVHQGDQDSGRWHCILGRYSVVFLYIASVLGSADEIILGAYSFCLGFVPRSSKALG